MNIEGRHYRTIWPDGEAVCVIDQTRLPFAFELRRLATMEDAAEAISTMIVRGAPLIGATAAYGVALAMRAGASDALLDEAVRVLGATRPTAVNLHWALERMARTLRPLRAGERAARAFAAAAAICDEDVACCRSIGEHGAALIGEVAARKRGEPVDILTHCNAGWLATVDWGTALAPIYVAHDEGVKLHVWVDETRPRNQGAALTAYELGARGARQRRAVLRRAAVLDHRLVAPRRRARNPDRGAFRPRGHAYDRADRRRRDQDGRGRRARQPGPESRLRRDAGAARHRPHHRTRRRQGEPRGASRPVPGTGRRLMDEAALREKIVGVAQALDRAGFCPSKSGNVSARSGDGCLITPSGLPYAAMQPGDVVEIDLRGKLRSEGT